MSCETFTKARGRFITFEGGEGAGKSTQVRRLATTLRANGIETLETREPGGSPGAEKIRRLLVEGDAGRWDGISETFLLCAARRDHLQKTILPALHRGIWVLCDRFHDSTVAYQGYGYGVDRATLDSLFDVLAQGHSPDLTLVLDIPVAVGLRRAKARGGAEDRYERMDESFHRRLRQGYLDIARGAPHRCRVIDAGQGREAVSAAIAGAVVAHFEKPFLQKTCAHGP